ncbi:MAG: hypothetical protein E7634_08760 [Ruminococcaceae bacterium]|nr:hypothetical protein [Oscillospiraceae bacterium]
MIILICCLLTGCGSPHMPIEDCAWRLQDAVMDSPDRYNQIAVDYDRKGDEPVEGVNYIICTLEAGDGGFTIRDKTNDLTFSGTYKLISSDRNAIVYLIDIGGVIGSAVSSALYYSDGAQTKTLTVSIGGYTLNFHEMK